MSVLRFLNCFHRRKAHGTESLALALVAMRCRAIAAEHAATHDPLTGLLNRAGLFAAAERTAYRWVTALDVDGLKVLNDSASHAAGDNLLRATAEAIRDSATEAKGVAARVGGDEFWVLSIDRPEFPATLSASWGYAEITEDLDTALASADAAMYTHKSTRGARRR